MISEILRALCTSKKVSWSQYNKSIITSRGCPYNCIYCSSSALWGRKWRKRSAENIFQEILYLKENYSIKDFLRIVDDNFLVDRDRFVKLIKLLETNNCIMPMGFSTRLEQVDDEILSICQKAKVKKIFFGIESGSNRVLKHLQRNYTQKEILEKIDLCVKHGILPVASFMIGIPFEDISDVRETFYVMRNLNTCYQQIHIFTPFIGTDVYKNPSDYGIKLDFDKLPDLSIDNEPVIETKYLNKNKIYDLYLEGLAIVQEKYGEAWKFS